MERKAPGAAGGPHHGEGDMFDGNDRFHNRSATKAQGFGLTDVPPRFARAAERASADDRKWFAANPRRTHRIRPPIGSYEHWLIRQAGLGSRSGTRFVVVRQIVPGARLKAPFVAWALPPDDEALAHALFDAWVENTRGSGDGVLDAAKVQAAAGRYAQAGAA